MVRLSLSLALLVGAVVPTLAQPALSDAPPALLVHGNYCGPGNNAPRPPIDALDAACARHDACTPSGGLPSRACNLRLQRDAARISRDPREPDEIRALAGLMGASVALLPSDLHLAAAPATGTGTSSVETPAPSDPTSLLSTGGEFTIPAVQ
ncbi:hypothetical protein [Methylobacterium sp. Leaf117]|uniref:hypothetical protein n=1 Tax=Methylobacterium sp. Leaf117 TaxID=1736260 RepID=UPI0006FCB6EB|nr:hypothetical protein [Methylobacterium sp. Leaf117]KQP96495.1 hypothetical protein ASF57_01745 [Methylobacterium sp. Leaf117]